MSWLEAVVLGLVQGLTEFLPISSSAHLRITSAFFFGNDAGAAFTAVSQLGTETAVLIYFWSDIWRLLSAWFAGLRNSRVRGYDYRLAWYVILGSIPIGVAGLLFQNAIEGPGAQPLPQRHRADRVRAGARGGRALRTAASWARPADPA